MTMPFPVVFVPRLDLSSWCHRPWSEVARAAAAGEAGLRLADSGTFVPVNMAVLREGESRDSWARGRALFYLQNW